MAKKKKSARAKPAKTKKRTAKAVKAKIQALATSLKLEMPAAL